jgi:hypothetical protein
MCGHGTHKGRTFQIQKGKKNKLKELNQNLHATS